MKQYLSSLILLAFFCSRLESMEVLSPKMDDIIRFDIGGCKIKTTRQTVQTFGGHVLNELISGKFAVKRDEEGCIFIDREPKEGKLIRCFMHTQQLPTNFDENMARSAADYFGNELMKIYIEEKKLIVDPRPKMSKIKIFKDEQECEMCTRCIHPFAEAVAHLVDEHNAKIIAFNPRYQDGWKIMYQVPIDER